MQKIKFRKGNCSFVIQNVWQKEKEQERQTELKIDKHRNRVTYVGGRERKRKSERDREREEEEEEFKKKEHFKIERKEHLIYWRICKFHNFQRELSSLC